MADFTALKSAIQTYIKQNGNEEINGEKLQEILLSVVTTLGDSAINDLITALANEVAARQNADGTLQQNITNEATARGNADTALSDRLGSTITAENTAADQIGAEAEARAAADTALQVLIDGITDNIENGYVYAGIATPSSTPTTGKVFYLALTAGTYTNFDNTEVSQGINILKFNGSAWSLDAFIGIDDELTPSSNNLPKSGNVLENIIKNGSAFDLSAYNAVDGELATYADLDAALTAINALPAVYKQGGMSFRFVCTSDNKYVQYRLMSQAFSTTESDWQGVDDEPTAGSDNLVKSGGVSVLQNENAIVVGKKVQGFFATGAWQFASELKDFISKGTYYIKLDSGYTSTTNGTGTLTIGSQSVTLIRNRWTKFECTQDYPTPIYLYGGENFPAPILSIIKEQFQSEYTLDSTTRIDDLSNKIDGYLYERTICLKQATASYSNDNLYKSSQENNRIIAQGSTIKIKLVSGAELINKFAVYYNSSYSAMFNETENIVNGRIFEFVCPVDVEYFGFYIGPSNVLGSGNLLLELYNEIGSTIEPKIKAMSTDIEKKQDKIDRHTINVSFDGTSASGRTIDYSGLTAISDALNSITNASEYNRYTIHVEGIFKFTDPLTLPMLSGGEYSAIVMKRWVDIEGDGPDKTMLIVDIAPNSTFHSGKSYSDYQPIYMRVGGRISNMRIVGKNCRYAFHLEREDEIQSDQLFELENLNIDYLGHPDYSGSYQGCIGAGISDGQVWNIKNCILRNIIGMNAFAVHTPLVQFKTPARINFKNCVFIGDLGFGNYQVENNTIINLIGCNFGKGTTPCVKYDYYNSMSIAKHGDYTTIQMQANELKALYLCDRNSPTPKGAVLRVVSSTTGNTSSVRFDKTGSAFSVLITKENDASPAQTNYFWDITDGYVYRDGGTNISGQAFGTIDIDENASNNVSLGKLLGDCSSTNKVLNVVIDGISHTITFDENYTNQDNSTIIGKINTAIDGYGVADIFCPAKLYYPMINGMSVVKCVDENSVLRGMGVVFVSGNGIRRAKNSDGYIDGIALDDIAANQFGRIITKGFIPIKIFRNLNPFYYYFTTMDDADIMFAVGGCGIDPNNDGMFKQGATPMLLRKKGWTDSSGNTYTCLEI